MKNPPHAQLVRDLPPGLRETVLPLTSDELLALSETVMNWADIIAAHAAASADDELPAAARAHAKVPPRGFVLVNFAKWEEDKLRALAECHVKGFTGIARDALHNAIDGLEADLGITAEQAQRMSKKARLAFRKQWAETRWRIFPFTCPEMFRKS